MDYILFLEGKDRILVQDAYRPDVDEKITFDDISYTVYQITHDVHLSRHTSDVYYSRTTVYARQK